MNCGLDYPYGGNRLMFMYIWNFIIVIVYNMWTLVSIMFNLLSS